MYYFLPNGQLCPLKGCCHSNLKAAKSNKQKCKSDVLESYKAYLIRRFLFHLTYFGVPFTLISLHFKIGNYTKKWKDPTVDKSITNAFITETHNL